MRGRITLQKYSNQPIPEIEARDDLKGKAAFRNVHFVFFFFFENIIVLSIAWIVIIHVILIHIPFMLLCPNQESYNQRQSYK